MKSMGWLRVPDELVQMAGIDSAELGLKAYADKIKKGTCYEFMARTRK